MIIVVCCDHCCLLWCKSNEKWISSSLSQLGVSLSEAELYLISKLLNTNVNPSIHISILWRLTENMKIISDRGGNIQAVDPIRSVRLWGLPVGNYSKYLMRTKLRLVPTNKFWFHLLANVIWTKFGVTLLIRPEPGLALAHRISEPQSQWVSRDPG